MSRRDESMPAKCDRIHLFNQAGIPARYINATFVSFAKPMGNSKTSIRAPSAHWACLLFVDAYLNGALNKGLVLHGDVGRGKPI